MIRTELTKELRGAMVEFLKENYDVFAWSQGDVLGIDSQVSFHKLFINPDHSPVCQKRRKFAPVWLANIVVSPKKEKKWRVCVNFTDLTKAFPKESFPLPKIDLIIDATSKHKLLSFMDTFFGYHQIKMHLPDMEKTFFITERGLYYYKVMPFRLKNARATCQRLVNKMFKDMYQRLVNKMFKDMIGKTMEVYIDNMLVKSLKVNDHIAHLEETFGVLLNSSLEYPQENSLASLRLSVELRPTWTRFKLY
ncbi:hypothetical protein Acr_05g0009470 [Actinidia rufa]|uniref:Reverse transcriptase domain-containing protein n=1 Tax=Actinidia rufa TaxID=165716 RepID=A0A7J0ELH7_9ERIC|nr:hypothetical protein Acr_05g0009470 [Actinidia rufa]